ncbi:copper resistance CopC family protein [Mycobacterium sp.]|jgi:methionine-rich copper-binding protein CopC|uniref:copper resistance CopC family protein n=1 Tax=Mycobacterium sp. TaxID=1785 RepID=UPI002D6EDFD5|nr:copper resistance CopC family protein [Mycobacterium sp.]HZA10409.1 copper resistance CopC family protein [Mycobacterium sp.]
MPFSRAANARLSARLGTLAVLLAAMTFVDPASASAHAWVTATDPPRNATISKAPSQVTTTFSEAVTSPQVNVVGPDHKEWSTGAATSAGADISVGMRPSPSPGIYTVNYKVTSGDGHVINGSWTFTLLPSAPKS